MSERVTEWQPIETAPKDGTPLLAFNPIVGVYNSAWDDVEAGFPCGFWNSIGCWYPVATHWMPLPPYPPPPEPYGDIADAHLSAAYRKASEGDKGHG